MSETTIGPESATSAPPSPTSTSSSSSQPPPRVPSSDGGASAAREGDGGAPGGGSQYVNINEANVDGLTVDQRTIGVQVESQIIQLFQGRAAVRRFACAEVEPVPTRWEDDSASAYRGLDTEVDSLLKLLEERRVLVLTAERGAGKVRAALYLGWHLRQRRQCTEGTLLVESLDRKVRVDVRHLAARDRDLRNRLVIFPNAFTRADPEIIRLFETTDRAGWQALTEQLRARGAYLVFTTDPAEACSLEQATTHGVHRRLAPHPEELLADELARKLDQLAADGADPALLDTLREGSGWMLETFHYAPQVFDFVDEYLEMGAAGLELAEAWKRMRNADGRILQDLDGDFEGWSFAFTLALAECGGEAGGVAWVDADRLHRHVRQWLRRDLNLRYPDSRDAAADADADADTRLEFSDTRLLKRAHAEVDTTTPSYTVRFSDGARPDGMWEAMFRRHRRALLTVLPGLRGLAERGDVELRSLSVLAARIIGRIGEMDPQRVVIPLMDRWSRSNRAELQAALGPLVDGVLCSRAERYRQACIRHLQALQRTPPLGGDDDEHLPAVIAAWSWVGDHDLPLAMRELGALVRDELAPVIGDTQQLERLLQSVEHAATATRSARRAAALGSCHSALRKVVSRMYAEQGGGAFLGVQFSVASLCATRGPVPVFTELRRWIREGGWQSAAVVALMFLNERGIANHLQQARAASGSMGASCGTLALWLAEGEEEIRQTSGFLGELFENLLTPFSAAAQMQRFCVESLQGHLTGWIRDALSVPEHAAAMRNFLEVLVRTHEGVLREPVVTLLDDLLAGDDHSMRRFATSVQV